MGKSKIIMKKELTRVFGDKKLVFSLFLLPALLVIGIYFLMGQMVDSMSQDIQEHIAKVYVVNAPDTVKWLVEETQYVQTADITWFDTLETEQSKRIEEEILNGTTELMVCFEQNKDLVARNDEWYKNEYKSFKYTPNFKRPITIIDPETAEEIEPKLYFDNSTNEIKGKIKMKPNKSYFTFEIE